LAALFILSKGFSLIKYNVLAEYIQIFIGKKLGKDKQLEGGNVKSFLISLDKKIKFL